MSRYANGSGDTVARLHRGGDLRTRRFDRAIQYLSDHWPNEIPWPSHNPSTAMFRFTLSPPQLTATVGLFAGAKRFERRVARTKLCPMTQPGAWPERDAQAEEYVRALARAAGHLARLRGT